MKTNYSFLLVLWLGIGVSLFPACSNTPSTGTIETVNDPIFPKADWSKSKPADQGMDSSLMAKALNYLENNSRHNGNKELLIIRNGYQIFGGNNIDSTHSIWSCSKTFTSTVLGLLVDDGILQLDQLAAPFEPILQEKYGEGTLKWPGAPEACYFASGFNNNKCIVIPHWNMVIVRMGEDGHPDDPDLVYSNFIKLLGRSIKT